VCEQKLEHRQLYSLIDLRDEVPFEADCVEDLVQAFHDSVEDYLAFCAERGEEPEKPFSGCFELRLDPELHRSVYLRSQAEDLSLNAWVVKTLEDKCVR
jgi:predicted HicB family RNase H-like nuclease